MPNYAGKRKNCQTADKAYDYYMICWYAFQIKCANFSSIKKCRYISKGFPPITTYTLPAKIIKREALWIFHFYDDVF
jgi:hypothetical protein